MKAIGLILPKEIVWAKVLQAARVAGMDVPDSAASVEYKRMLKSMLKKMTKGMVIKVGHFPLNPAELECYQDAYQDDQPVRLDEGRVIEQGVISLRTSKADAKRSKTNPKSVPLLSLESQPGPSPQEMFGQLGMMMMNMFQQSCSVNPDARGSGLGMFRPPGAPKAKMIEDGQAAPAEAATPPVASVLAITADKETAKVTAEEDEKHVSPNTTPMKGAQPADAVLLSKPPLPSKKPAANVKTAKGKSKGHETTVKNVKAAKGWSKGKKQVETIKCKKGWIMEIRTRESGQKDKHYKAPDGKMYRIQSEAVAKGFPGEP